ncbi:MAG: hypothetical protein AB2793_02285 [Candidatus Thiodiazotropha sp.]
MHPSHISNDQSFQFDYSLPILSAERYIAIASLSIIVWIFTHPYHGIWHDASLYTAQSLKILYPEIYRGDIFFKYGSQASFTIFPFIQALAIQLIGVDSSAFLLTIIGLTLFFTSTLSLTRTYLSSAQTVLFLILFTTLPVFINPVLYIFEVFLTSRNFSLGLSLLFLNFVLKRRFVLATVFLLIALLLHPLVPLGAFAIAVFLQKTKVILTIVTLGLLFLVTCLLFSIPPMNLLTQTIDAEWRELINQRSPFLFVEKWLNSDLSLLLLEISIILTARAYCTDKLKQIFNAVLIATSLCLAVSLVASWVSNTLLIQLQTWRILVFTHIFSVIAFTWIMTAAWSKDNGKVIVLLYSSMFLTFESIGGLPALVIHIFCFFILKRHYTPPLIVKGAYAILLQCAFWYLLNINYIDPTSITANPIFTYSSNIKHFLYSSPLLITAYLMALFYFSKKRQKTILVTLGITIILFLPFTIYFFDQRHRNATWNNGNSEPYITLRNEIPESATVYCEQGVEACWLSLRRQHYMSPKQSAGIVFSRETAIEAKRRSDLLLDAGFEDGVFPRHWHDSNVQITPIPKAGAFDRLCQDPILDYIVSTSLNTPKTPDKIIDTPNTTIHIYNCSIAP